MKSTREDRRGTHLDILGDSPSRDWHMRSSSGRIGFSCRLLRASLKTRSVVCELGVTGQFFRRGVTASSGDLVPDFDVRLSQVMLDVQALQNLRDRLVEWHTNPGAFEVELGTSEEGDQRLSLALAQDPNLLFEVHKPACVVTYFSPSAMQGRWSFVVDQSCVRSCAEELRDFLA